MKNLFFTALAVLFMAPLAIANDNEEENQPEKSLADTKRMFIYHFIKYIEWPTDKQSTFVMGVYGDSEMLQTMQASFNGLNRNGQVYTVRAISTPEEAAKCNLVYAGNISNKVLGEFFGVLEGKSTLLITDRLGLGTKGSAINFRESNGVLKFELNLQAVEKAGLKVSGQLKQVAILI